MQANLNTGFLQFLPMLSATAQDRTSAANPNAGFIQFLPLIFLMVVFYFILIRPQKKKQVEHQKMIQSLKKNDLVVTSGGVHGTIVSVKEKTFALRIDDNVKIELDKNSISYVKKQRDDQS